MNEVHIIKKYPNRRLYDTSISSYITLDDIKKLVMSHRDFKIVDARTEEDLTNNTLLQIIIEQEDHGTPIFTNHILQNMIRFYGNSMQSLMSSFLEQSMDMFMQQKNPMQYQIGKSLESQNPFDAIGQLTRQNLDLFRVWQDSMINYFTKYTPKDQGEE